MFAWWQMKVTITFAIYPPPRCSCRRRVPAQAQAPDPPPACATEADRVEGAGPPIRDLHGRGERCDKVQLVLAASALVVDGLLLRGPRLIRGADQSPSLGLARVGRECEAAGQDDDGLRNSWRNPRADFAEFYLWPIV